MAVAIRKGIAKHEKIEECTQRNRSCQAGAVHQGHLITRS
jgi:hypothetical protein